FELRWRERPATAKRMTLVGVAAAAAATARALWLPIAVPFVGAGAAVAAGWLTLEHARWRAERWRHLERQVQDSEAVAERLFASLHDLVSDLRLDEVVAKVTRHAQAAVGGREFLLL